MYLNQMSLNDVTGLLHRMFYLNVETKYNKTTKLGMPKMYGHILSRYVRCCFTIFYYIATKYFNRIDIHRGKWVSFVGFLILNREQV